MVYSGIVSIRKTAQTRQFNIKSNSNWFGGCLDYWFEFNDYGFIIHKCWVERPKNVYRYTKSGFFIREVFQCGTFQVDSEDSTEDKLVIYYD